MKRLFVLFAVILLSTVLFADENVPPHSVKVTGTADVNVTPDRAVVRIGVEKQSSSATAAKKAADAAAREVLSVLHDSGIADKDVKTDWLSLAPQYDWRNGRITSFSAEQSLTVTVRELSKLDSLLDALIKAGGNRINSVQFETSDLRKYRDQAREMAVTAAREKAEALAKALGQSIGKAISLEEIPQSTNPYYGGYLSNSVVELDKQRTQVGPAIAAGERKVTASVTIWFELQ